MLKFDASVARLYDVRHVPYWRDACRHPEGSYLFSFTAADDLHDVYCFPSATWGCEFCLRYGDGDSDYYSPGSATNVLACRYSEPYRGLVTLLEQCGHFVWQPKTKE